MMSGPFTAVFNGMKLEVTEEHRDDRTTTLFLNGTHLDVMQMNQSGSMEGNGRPYREIMDTLGIPERTFYRYLSQAYEHDRQLLAEQDKDKLALELSILHDRLTSTYRRLILIAGNENVSAKDRIDAEAASCEVALAITKLAFEGPIVLKDFAHYLR
jgi:hypothetical protein